MNPDFSVFLITKPTDFTPDFICYVMWMLNMVSYSSRTIRVKVSEKIFEPDVE